MTHLSHDEITAFVMGTTPLDEQRKSHLVACPRCSERLTEEARLEVMVRDSMIGRTLPTPASPPRQLPLAWVAALAIVVMSASVALLASREARRAPPSPPSPSRMTQVVSPEEAPCLIDPRTLALGYTAGRTGFEQPLAAVPVNLSFR